MNQRLRVAMKICQSEDHYYRWQARTQLNLRIVRPRREPMFIRDGEVFEMRMTRLPPAPRGVVRRINHIRKAVRVGVVVLDTEQPADDKPDGCDIPF